MSLLSITQTNTAIAETLGSAAGISRAQDAADLTEGMPDLPALQVYWQSLSTDADSADTDRRTFGAGVRVSRLTFHADVYARQRSHLGEDMARVLELAEAVQTVLENQTTPLFGEEHIQSCHWSAQRVTFDYAGASYAGIRFIIDLTVF